MHQGFPSILVNFQIALLLDFPAFEKPYQFSKREDFEFTWGGLSLEKSSIWDANW